MAFNDNSPADDDWGIVDEESNPQSDGVAEPDADWENAWNSSWDDNTEEDSSSEGSSGWDDVPDDASNGSFIEPDDWEQSQGVDTEEQFDDFNQNQYVPPIEEVIPTKFKLSPQKAAFVIAGILILLALVFMFIDSIHIDKVDKTPQQNTQVQESNTTPPVDEQPAQQDKTPVNTNSVVLVEVPASLSLNYSGDVLTANGTVASKAKFVQGTQVLYCITINLVFGSSSETINYYCNYASYNAVSNGDIVVVTYQQVEDSYISVNSISK